MGVRWLPDRDSATAESHETIERVFDFGRGETPATACACECGCGGATYDENTGFYAASNNRSARNNATGSASGGPASVEWWT